MQLPESLKEMGPRTAPLNSYFRAYVLLIGKVVPKTSPLPSSPKAKYGAVFSVRELTITFPSRRVVIFIGPATVHVVGAISKLIEQGGLLTVPPALNVPKSVFDVALYTLNDERHDFGPLIEANGIELKTVWVTAASA